MHKKSSSRLSKKTRYLQIALNSTLEDAANVISILPPSERIIIEAGTPLIKRYGMNAIRSLRDWWGARLWGGVGAAPSAARENPFGIVGLIAKAVAENAERARTRKFAPSPDLPAPYVVADMKTMDRGRAEVEMVANAGASGIIALGTAPIETLDTFIAACEEFGVDAMVDMMNVEFPIAVLRELKRQPKVVVLHRGVDEERENRQKMLPLHEVRRVKGAYDLLIAVAGGDTPREVQSAAFNDADIVVVWKSVYERNADTQELVEGFLKTIK
ncbi:MAG: hypothetical protein A3C93_03455 [Candidatus Lloydbacteria bacterium RIFCSPHIGHO2_02_FULL_54_17]|uniref:Orotidine 5'-phosphate decarboxylase domain-containing protein n=1 Tax=Candidatus Lloydbacteria bacterium RIFCSPHIGHO2_02_FULL_54_17 TaxID=1798664 RepID=A0A1G2DFM6_9BACT|nr:MAG: hypothetical protein A2762_01080 [Candidatus Lloydbacteria bacterium RIFCSPHIGHO2_01_FULL_54_11]OGZ12343.1 MAG: hypothetical protein A3C93_03455 [Candidatus Lloydbacteria bacterium RIFCSPHIGHO2_02_FULL_54_17]OGZ14486.1 MAG: hypothetical protein A3H76_06005 [Candidatus Lloydbacteria bacterium RIFCSPLOWO2_02_FULL_54_12]OGZ14564.1 MAG: hypothetical protein A2948_05665 [Candidatus Lloydbacteria bacterium RIFCSPLOWO2_01_FULL_54_18]